MSRSRTTGRRKRKLRVMIVELPGLNSGDRDTRFDGKTSNRKVAKPVRRQTALVMTKRRVEHLRTRRRNCFTRCATTVRAVPEKRKLPANPSDYNDPANEVLFPMTELGIRPCNGHEVQRDENGDVVYDTNNNPVITPARFNPVVLGQVFLPNGQTYTFKYNRFGEISKLIYPTGAIRDFTYAAMIRLGRFSVTANQLTEALSSIAYTTAPGRCSGGRPTRPCGIGGIQIRNTSSPR